MVFMGRRDCCAIVEVTSEEAVCRVNKGGGGEEEMGWLAEFHQHEQEATGGGGPSEMGIGCSGVRWVYAGGVSATGRERES